MSRQKQVYTTGEIPHLWAHQTQDYARNQQNNLFFEGPVIYSYGHHHAIAKLFPEKNVVLFNNDTVSNTTAGHHSAVSSALTGRWTRFYVPYPDMRSRIKSGQHKYNIAHLAQNVRNAEIAAEKVVTDASKIFLVIKEGEKTDKPS